MSESSIPNFIESLLINY